VDHTLSNDTLAYRATARQAMSLLELIAVVVILGVVAGALIASFADNTLGNGGAEGHARKLALSLMSARRSTIASGDNHYVELNSSSGKVVSYTIIRRASGGDTQVDQLYSVPSDVTVTSASSQLEFDFEGAGLSAYSVTVAGPDRSWTVAVTMLTGAVQVTENP